jgi:hypothetical protein
MTMSYCATNRMTADLLTACIAFLQFKYLRSKLNRYRFFRRQVLNAEEAYRHFNMSAIFRLSGIHRSIAEPDLWKEDFTLMKHYLVFTSVPPE